jgi:hypothetical protein
MNLRGTLSNGSIFSRQRSIGDNPNGSLSCGFGQATQAKTGFS